MRNKENIIIFGLIGLAGLIYLIFWQDVKSAKQKIKTEKAHSGILQEKGGSQASDLVVLEKWDLPDDLKEVSGIAYMDEQRFACVQDEKGTIFIYNRTSKKIEKEIQFAGIGDFEGLTLKGNIAYVVRADGKIFEVDLNAGSGSAKEYSTSLTTAHNVEGLCYDKKNDRLLLAIKDEDPSYPGYKGIYAFDLSKKSFQKEPVYKIDLQDDIITASNTKKKNSVMPSAMGIHPLTNEFFITDGPKARLLIMDESGKISKLLDLGSAFSQPEGITFSPEGEVFISNEGTKDPGNIIRIQLKKK